MILLTGNVSIRQFSNNGPRRRPSPPTAAFKRDGGWPINHQNGIMEKTLSVFDFPHIPVIMNKDLDAPLMTTITRNPRRIERYILEHRA